MGVSQALINFPAGPLFGSIYRATVGSLPQTFLIVIAGCYAFNWIAYCFVDIRLKRVWSG